MFPVLLIGFLFSNDGILSSLLLNGVLFLGDFFKRFFFFLVDFLILNYDSCLYFRLNFYLSEAFLLDFYMILEGFSNDIMAKDG